MADSPALRAKRARRHKAGDHRLCRSDTCDAAGSSVRDADTTVTSPVTPSVTTGDTRGARLWAQMDEGRGLAPTHVVLLEEACRLADRLDRLDEMLSNPGRAWLNFEVSEDGSGITVTVDRLLSEARMQETTYKVIVAELRQALEDTGSGRLPADSSQAFSGGGGNVVGLRAAVLAKRAQTAG